MAHIERITNSMDALENFEKEQRTILSIIKELKSSKSILIKELPTFEEELTIWQEDLKKLEGHKKTSDDIKIWENEIKDIQLKIKEKKLEIERNENEIENAVKECENLNKRIKTLNLKIKDSIYKILKDEDSINNHNENELFILTKILRNVLDSRIDFYKFLEIITEEEIKISLKLLEIINHIFNDELIIIPEIVVKFISNYLNNQENGKILDPWPLNGLLTKSINSQIVNKEFITYKKSEDILFNTLHKNVDLNYITPYSDVNFKFIIGYPPYNYLEDIRRNFKDLKILDTNQTMNFLKMAVQLSEDGQGIFILNEDFLLNRKKVSVLANINKLGLYIKAIIEIPHQGFPDENEKILIFISRKFQDKIFLGSLSEDNENNKVLLKNLINTETGRIPQYGYLTSIDSFYSFKSLYAQIESLKISNDYKLPLNEFSDYIEEIHFPSEKSKFLDKPNSIFLPLDLTLKIEVDPQNIKDDFIQIVLNNENCLAEYLTTYINTTEVGWKIRESINLGSNSESLIEEVIRKIQIYLPNLNKQVEILTINSKINEIATIADSQREQLWKRPNEYQSIIKDIESLDDKSEYHFEKWVESLPYPLASILWESFSTTKPDLKVRYLLHFFESLSEFIVNILLSGLIKDERFLEYEFNNCITDNRKFKNWYLSPSFGNWNHFAQCIGRTIQNLLKKQYQRNNILNLFGNPDPEFINKITSYKLFEILSEVNRYRNSWDAHGPVVSSQEYENRHNLLRNSISKLFEHLGNTFNHNLLVLPLDSTFNDGIHHYTVKKFMGSRNRFISIKIDTVIPMDSKNIYLITGNYRNPIKLLPLLKYYNNSCYFYNSSPKDHNQIEYVSYHNIEEPIINYSKLELESFFSIFRQFNNYYKRY